MANIDLLARQLFDERTLSSPSYAHDRDIDVLKATKHNCVSDDTAQSVVGKDLYSSSSLELSYEGS